VSNFFGVDCLKLNVVVENDVWCDDCDVLSDADATPNVTTCVDRLST